MRPPAYDCVSDVPYEASNPSTSACSSFSLLFFLRSFRLMNRNPNQCIRQLSLLTLRLTTLLSRFRNARYSHQSAPRTQSNIARKPENTEDILTTRHTNRPQHTPPVRHHSRNRFRSIAQRCQFLFQLLHLPSETCAQVAQLAQRFQFAFLLVDARL